MKTNKILYLLLLLGMLIGCKDCEEAFVVSRMKCEIDGVSCEAKYKFNFITDVYSYHRGFFSDANQFNLQLDADFSDEVMEKTDVFQIEIRTKISGSVEFGKKYPLMNLCDIDPDNVPGNVCWIQLICLPRIGNGTQYPEELRNHQAVVRTDKSAGYVVFDDFEYSSSDKDRGTVHGHFEVVAEGENACYPEIKVKTSVKGSFSYSVYDGTTGSDSFSPIGALLPECIL